MGIKKIARELQKRRDALINTYDAEDLHQLRISIRRLRNLLKQHPSEQAKSLKSDWSALMQYTNEARDWDTILINESNLLSEEELALLKPFIEAHCADAHKHVVTSLKSATWQNTYRNSKLFLAENNKSRFKNSVGAISLNKALKQTLKFEKRALREKDECNWHKLRIAIKNLRYTLDNDDLIDKKKRRKLKPLIKLCKQLQQFLGDWHDTVIHRELLFKLEYEIQPAEHNLILQRLETISVIMREHGEKQLSEVKKLMDMNRQKLISLMN